VKVKKEFSGNERQIETKDCLYIALYRVGVLERFSMDINP
jgi:hypothetical protein